LILLGIVWNAFCNAFSSGLGIDAAHAVFLSIFVPTLHLASLAATFLGFSLAGFPREDVVAAMFVASHKGLAFGLPLVNTIFEGNPNLAFYCAPIMFIHPLQLVVGSFVMPRLVQYIDAGKKEADGKAA
jgi:sodium/bile acid cotransporter 7